MSEKVPRECDFGGTLKQSYSCVWQSLTKNFGKFVTRYMKNKSRKNYVQSFSISEVIS